MNPSGFPPVIRFEGHSFSSPVVTRPLIVKNSFRMQNLFELKATRISERCVFCLNLLRQLSKLAD